jgi:hypothetical protein
MVIYGSQFFYCFFYQDLNLGLGQTEVEALNLADQEMMRQEILSLLGMTHVPSKNSPHFESHLGNTTVNFMFMMDIYRSLTEDEAGVLKSKLDEPELEWLRNNAFHIRDTDIKVQRHKTIETFVRNSEFRKETNNIN